MPKLRRKTLKLSKSDRSLVDAFTGAGEALVRLRQAATRLWNEIRRSFLPKPRPRAVAKLARAILVVVVLCLQMSGCPGRATFLLEKREPTFLLSGIPKQRRSESSADECTRVH